MIKKMYNKKLNKGFVSLEIMFGVVVVSTALIFGVSLLTNYLKTEKARATAENIELIKNFAKKTNFDFANLNGTTMQYVPEKIVIKNGNNDLFLLPLKKPLKTYPYYNNSISNFKRNEKIGFTLSLKNLSNLECNIIAPRIATKFYETYIVPNNVDATSLSDTRYLVHLIPRPTINTQGRNKVQTSKVIELCASDKEDRQIVVRDIDHFDLKVYLNQSSTVNEQEYRRLLNDNNINLTSYKRKEIEEILQNKIKVEEDYKFYQDSLNFREKRQEKLDK